MKYMDDKQLKEFLTAVRGDVKVYVTNVHIFDTKSEGVVQLQRTPMQKVQIKFYLGSSVLNQHQNGLS